MIVKGAAIVEGGSPDYDVSPDGQRFLIMKPESANRVTELHIVLNWIEELKRSRSSPSVSS